MKQEILNMKNEFIKYLNGLKSSDSLTHSEGKNGRFNV